MDGEQGGYKYQLWSCVLKAYSSSFQLSKFSKEERLIRFLVWLFEADHRVTGWTVVDITLYHLDVISRKNLLPLQQAENLQPSAQSCLAQEPTPPRTTDVHQLFLAGE